MSKKIKGITIELAGDATPLEKALNQVDKASKNTSKELNQINRALKFDSNNIVLLEQKFEVLQDAISHTSTRLSALKQAQAEVDRQFKAGEIDAKTYREFQREIETTANRLEYLKRQLTEAQQEQKDLEKNTKQLESLFRVTGTSVDKYASILGDKLTRAIKDGTASSKQLNEALEKIGREALGTNADLDKMRQALQKLESGTNLEKIRKEFNEIAKAAQNAEKDVKGLGEEIAGIAGGIVAGGGIAGAINQALDSSRVNTQIDISFNVPEESKKAVKDAVNTIKAYGVDAAAALEGVRRQWALNKDATDEANKKIIEGAGMIAASYEGIDFTELIQEINEISSELNISNEEALGLTNALLKIGFPPEQLDIIAEYGQQLTRAGFSAQEVQAIMAAGVETGTWNIDNLLDGLKEGRIRIAELGQEVPKALTELIEGTNISEKQLMLWGRAVAKGGKDGSRAMIEIAKALNGVQDETKKNLIGIQLFGTMYEDQGQNIIDTLLNMNGHMSNTAQNQEKLNESIDKLNSDPMTKLNKAFGDLKIALEPLLSVIADFVSIIATFISANPVLAGAITAVVSAVGILTGALMSLAPIIYSLQNAIPLITKALPLLGRAFTAVGGPIGIIIGILVTAVPLIIKHWDSIVEFFSNLWETVKTIFETVIDAIINFIKENWQTIKEFTLLIWNSIKDFFAEHWQSILTIFTGPIGLIIKLITSNWETIKNTTITVWDFIKTSLSTAWNTIKSTSTTVWNGIKNKLVEIWNGIKNTASNLWNGLKTAIITPVDLIQNAVTNAFQNIKDKIAIIWSGLKTVVKEPINAVIGMINEFIRGLNKIKAPDWVPKIGGKRINIPEIPMLAKGTNYFKGGLAIVGEKGPELVELPQGSKVYPNSRTQQMVGGGDIIINVSQLVVREEADIKRIARELFNLQQTKNRGGSRG